MASAVLATGFPSASENQTTTGRVSVASSHFSPVLRSALTVISVPPDPLLATVVGVNTRPITSSHARHRGRPPLESSVPTGTSP